MGREIVPIDKAVREIDLVFEDTVKVSETVNQLLKIKRHIDDLLEGLGYEQRGRSEYAPGRAWRSHAGR